MFGQAIPIGINLTSPATWFVVAVVAIVLALTVSTRRSTIRAGSARAVPDAAPNPSPAVQARADDGAQ